MIILIFVVACVGFTIAGEGGFVYLINLSGSDWKQTRHEPCKMNDWRFPALLKNTDTAFVYVEFGNDSNSASARVDYELVGTGGESFQILAQENPRRIEVVFSNLKMDSKPLGTKQNLGWRHNGETNFVIIRYNGKYTGITLDGSNWMKDNIDALGKRNLKQISIPGSHNAGMSILSKHTDYGKACNVLYQSYGIREQLKLGIRYFDIRPVIDDAGEYFTGHYKNLAGSWEGGNGQSIASIITDLNDFTNTHNELIVIKLSHSLNTELKYYKYRSFNQSEWDKLFEQLDRINHLYNNVNNNSLEDVTLNDYTNKGSRSSVIIIVDDPKSNVQLGSRLGKGYFMSSSLGIYYNTSASNNWSEMIYDQINKMHQHSIKQYFLLSWILTQSRFQALVCKPSVKDLADEANIYLGHLLYKEVSASSYPNIILVDNVRATDVATLALAINTKIML